MNNKTKFWISTVTDYMLTMKVVEDARKSTDYRIATQEELEILVDLGIICKEDIE